MKMNIALKRALASILFAAAISSLASAEADKTVTKTKHIVIKGTGRNISVKQSDSAPVSSVKAAQMNKEYQKGYDAGYRNANNAGFKNGYSAGQVQATGGTSDAALATPIIDKSDFGGTAQFQSGYRAGYNAGYAKSFDVGMVRGYNVELAQEAAINASLQQPVAVPTANTGVTFNAATTSLGVQQFGGFSLFRPVLPNAPQPPVLNPLFGRLR